MITIKHILLFILVFILVIWFFESLNQKYKAESFEEYPHIVESPIVPELKTIPTGALNSCPLKENDLKTKYYINRFLMGDGAQICPRPVQTAKDFHKDFYKFRDYTYNNSSMTLDPVDKITNLYLEGYLGEAREYPGMKIRDVFDYLTGPCTKLYDKPCVRVPNFDNTMHNGYNSSFVTGMYNTRDTWQYPNEKEINGGQLEKNFYAHDPEDVKHFPVLN